MPNSWRHIATEYWFDPTTFLAWVAGRTQLHLLTDIIVVPYRTPVHTAKLISTLDFVSKGRVIFGASVGYLEDEFKTLHVPFEDRGPRTDEYLRAMQALWTLEQPTFTGKYFSFSDLTFWPKPVQKPHPPIWIGGRVKASIRRAVEFGQGWIPYQVEYSALSSAVSYLDQLLAEKGRTRQGFEVAWPMDRISIQDHPVSGERRMFQGSPEQIIRDMEMHAADGVTFWMASFQGATHQEYSENLERFAREIMPKFKALAPKRQ